MKNSYIALLCLFAFTASAQITVTQADLGTIGTVIVEARDTTTNVSPGNAGTNQTWDLTALQPQAKDTTRLLSPTGQPCSSNFTSANMVVTEMSDLIYVNVNSSELAAVGFCQVVPVPTAIPLNPPAKLITFPSTYQTTFNQSYQIAFQFYLGTFSPFDSMRVVTTTDVNSEMDGWGTVTTPTGSFSALRQKVIEYSSDSNYVHDTITKQWSFQPPATYDTSITYRWWANNRQFAVAEIMTDGNGNVTDKSYQLSATIGFKEIEPIQQSMVFPNPSVNEVNIQLNIAGSEDVRLTVYNSLGQQISEATGNSSRTFVVNTADVKGGIYFFTARNKNNLVLSNGKFAIVK